MGISQTTKAQIKTGYSPACEGLCLPQLSAVAANQLPHFPFLTEPPDCSFFFFCIGAAYNNASPFLFFFFVCFLIFFLFVILKTKSFINVFVFGCAGSLLLRAFL